MITYEELFPAKGAKITTANYQTEMLCEKKIALANKLEEIFLFVESINGIIDSEVEIVQENFLLHRLLQTELNTRNHGNFHVRNLADDMAQRKILYVISEADDNWKHTNKALTKVYRKYKLAVITLKRRHKLLLKLQ